MNDLQGTYAQRAERDELLERIAIRIRFLDLDAIGEVACLADDLYAAAYAKYHAESDKVVGIKKAA